MTNEPQRTSAGRLLFLEIPLPFIPNSVLCPLISLSRYLRSVPAPLFVVSQGASLRPTLAAHFNQFFKACVVSVGLNPGFFALPGAFALFLLPIVSLLLS